jgi:hypothetical protein
VCKYYTSLALLTQIAAVRLSKPRDRVEGRGRSRNNDKDYNEEAKYSGRGQGRGIIVHAGWEGGMKGTWTRVQIAKGPGLQDRIFAYLGSTLPARH